MKKKRSFMKNFKNKSVRRAPNDLALRIVTVMSKRFSEERAPSPPPLNSSTLDDREMMRTSLAIVLNLPKSRVTNALLNKLIRQIRKDAEDDAKKVAAYLDQLVDHLTSIGCTTDREIEAYLDAEERVLLEIYDELRRPQPSPTLLRQLSVQYALDARQRVNSAIRQLEIRQIKDGYEIAVHPPGHAKIPSLPYPGRVVRNPHAIQLLSLMQQVPPPFFQLMQLIEMLIPRAPSVSERTEQMSPIEVNLEQSIVSLQGVPYPVTMEAARFMRILIDDPNVWVSTKDFKRDEALKVTRCDRVCKSLPKPIRELVESKTGTGYRLCRKRLAQLCQKSSVAVPTKKANDIRQRCL